MRAHRLPQMGLQGRRSGGGFTLVEVMIAVAILMILLAAAAPDFRKTLQNQRLTASTNDFLAAILLTRSEAIARGTRMDMVPAAGDDWASGWVIFEDVNSNQARDASETLVFSHGPLAPGVTVSTTLPGAAHLTYNGMGRSRGRGTSQGMRSGSFLISLDGVERKIVINMLGRARVCTPESGNNSANADGC